MSRDETSESQVFSGGTWQSGERLLAAAASAIALTTLGLAVVGLATSGVGAGAAVLLGGLVGALSAVGLIRGLAGLLGAGAQAARARSVGLTRFVLRHALAGAAVYGALVLASLPAGWLLLGLSTWPVALVLTASRLQLASPSRS